MIRPPMQRPIFSTSGVKEAKKRSEKGVREHTCFKRICSLPPLLRTRLLRLYKRPNRSFSPMSGVVSVKLAFATSKS